MTAKLIQEPKWGLEVSLHHNKTNSGIRGCTKQNFGLNCSTAKTLEHQHQIWFNRLRNSCLLSVMMPIGSFWYTGCDHRSDITKKLQSDLKFGDCCQKVGTCSCHNPLFLCYQLTDREYFIAHCCGLTTCDFQDSSHSYFERSFYKLKVPGLAPKVLVTSC